MTCEDLPCLILELAFIEGKHKSGQPSYVRSILSRTSITKHADVRGITFAFKQIGG